MAGTFQPPSRTSVPFTTPVTPAAQQVPWVFFGEPVPKGINVYQLTDGSFTEQQPADMSTVVKVYNGGHLIQISTAEAAALTAAGYGAYVASTATGIFGDGIFGDGIFGGS